MLQICVKLHRSSVELMKSSLDLFIRHVAREHFTNKDENNDERHMKIYLFQLLVLVKSTVW